MIQVSHNGNITVNNDTVYNRKTSKTYVFPDGIYTFSEKYVLTKSLDGMNLYNLETEKWSSVKYSGNACAIYGEIIFSTLGSYMFSYDMKNRISFCNMSKSLDHYYVTENFFINQSHNEVHFYNHQLEFINSVELRWHHDVQKVFCDNSFIYVFNVDISFTFNEYIDIFDMNFKRLYVYDVQNVKEIYIKNQLLYIKGDSLKAIRVSNINPTTVLPEGP